METLIQQLRTILGTNFGLYFKAHSYHWNVEGPNFNDYHAFLWMKDFFSIMVIKMFFYYDTNSS